MKILFAHQNFPAQYRYLAAHFGAAPENQVVAVAKRGDANIPGVRVLTYKPKREPTKDIHHYIREFENHILHGQAVAEILVKLRSSGFRPDIVCAHPGWGETLYIKDIFPKAPLLSYCEFFYRSAGSDVGFDPKNKPSLDTLCRVRTRNASLLVTLEACDHGIVPTRWQWQQHPPQFLSKISVIHDGIRTDLAIPKADAAFALPGAGTLTRADEVVTYVARNLEPYRGFPSFMQAAAIIARRRPKVRFIVVGGDEVSYGAKLPDGRSYREKMLSEVDIDRSRLHFLGRVPYEEFIRVLQVSSVHVYLTLPFVLSWSMLEAMSAGCLVAGSDTAPVTEVIRDGENGLLVDFFSPESIADAVDRVLDAPDRMATLRKRARQNIIAKYELKRCMAQQLALMRRLAGQTVPARVPAKPRAPVRRR